MGCGELEKSGTGEEGLEVSTSKCPIPVFTSHLHLLLHAAKKKNKHSDCHLKSYEGKPKIYGSSMQREYSRPQNRTYSTCRGEGWDWDGGGGDSVDRVAKTEGSRCARGRM